MYYFLHQLKKRIAVTVRAIGDLFLFLGIVLVGGLGSGWYMVEQGSALTTHSIGPWRSWTSAGRIDADPYTRAHFARIGSLPITTEIASTYTARTDSAGIKLQGRCRYLVEGKDLAASWWSLTVFTDRGKLVPNALQRYGYTSDTVALRADGTFTVSLARDMQAGNWVPTSGSGRVALVLNLIEPRSTVEDWSVADDLGLPTIRRVDCP